MAPTIAEFLAVSCADKIRLRSRSERSCDDRHPNGHNSSLSTASQSSLAQSLFVLGARARGAGTAVAGVGVAKRQELWAQAPPGARMRIATQSILTRLS